MEKVLDGQDKVQAALRAELRSLLVKDEDGTLLLLQTNHDKSVFFANYLRHGVVPDPEKATFLADRDLAKAIAECEEFVADWSNEYDLLDLASLIKNRLTFIFHEIEDEAVVYTVFEVLNSRGLEVAWLDRAKSTLMGIAFEYSKPGRRKEVIDELHHTWGDIYATIGLHEGMNSESLRIAATLASSAPTSKVLSDEASVDVLRALCDGKVGKTRELSQWIHSVAIRVDQLLSDRRRAAVTKIAHARLLAVAILLADFDDDEKDRLLDQWERVTFRIFGMARRDARTKVGEYVRLAQQVQTLAETPKGFAVALDGLQQLGADDEYQIDKAANCLWRSDRYEGWEEELRYFLFRYEEHLADEAGQVFSNEQWERIWEASPSRTIEHIHPQNPASGGAWTGALGRGRGQREAHVHRLGNLVLLPPGLNSKLGNVGFGDKKREYRKCGLLHLQEVWKKQAWTKSAIENREWALIKWAMKAWADL